MSEDKLLTELQQRYPDEFSLWQEEAKKRHIGLEEYLYQTNRLNPTELIEIKKAVYNLPAKTFAPQEIIDEAVLHTVPETTAKNYQFIAFDRKEQELYIGVVDPEKPNVIEALNFLRNSLGVEIKLFVLSLADFYYVLRQYHSFSRELKNLLDQFRTRTPRQEVEETVRLSEEILPTEEAPVIKLIELIVEQAVSDKASDIHLEPLTDRTRIRFRIQGELRTVAYLPKDIHYQLVNRIKILSNLKIEETRNPQDGRFRAWVSGREIDFRVGILPIGSKEKVALRILDPVVGLKKLSEIGLTDYSLDKVQTASRRPFGLIFISGPTSSGKTTTLYAILQELNREEVNIVSLEDPVEYHIEGINQSQIRPEIRYTFASGLREILRQDPDIILVGEVRDRETAELVVHAALTGRLVLSTIHTRDALGAITRLLDIGIARYLLPETLLLLVAQRLARRLCDDCKITKEANPEMSAVIEESLKNLSKAVVENYKLKQRPYKIFYPNGCQKCNHKGFTGRIAIFEVVMLTEELKNLIYTGATESQLREVLPNQQFVSLRQDGIIKALQGLVNLEEIIKIT
jgi:type IV pilus assembly protein PilB